MLKKHVALKNIKSEENVTNFISKGQIAFFVLVYGSFKAIPSIAKLLNFKNIRFFVVVHLTTSIAKMAKTIHLSCQGSDH